MPLSWRKAESLLPRDVTLWDLVVFGTTLDDWQSVVAAIITDKGLEHDYIVNGESKTLNDAHQAFEQDAKCSRVLKVRFNNLGFNSHFNRITDIVFDAYEPEVIDQATLSIVGDFMKLLGLRTSKKVHLTSERDHEYPIITYSPSSGRFSYHKAETWDGSTDRVRAALLEMGKDRS